jgi:hypothetical protein
LIAHAAGSFRSTHNSRQSCDGGAVAGNGRAVEQLTSSTFNASRLVNGVARSAGAAVGETCSGAVGSRSGVHIAARANLRYWRMVITLAEDILREAATSGNSNSTTHVVLTRVESQAGTIVAVSVPAADPHTLATSAELSDRVGLEVVSVDDISKMHAPSLTNKVGIRESIGQLDDGKSFREAHIAASGDEVVRSGRSRGVGIARRNGVGVITIL